MAESANITDTTSDAIKRCLQRLAAAQQFPAPATPAATRQVRTSTRPEQQEENVRQLMQTAVYTQFFGAPPQFAQFKEYVDYHWASRDWIKVTEIRAAPRRGAFLTSLFSSIGSTVRVPYVTQHLTLPSARALVLWDIRLPLVQQLTYEYATVSFRQPVRFIHLGDPCVICGLGMIEGCRCSNEQPGDLAEQPGDQRDLPAQPPLTSFVQLLAEQQCAAGTDEEAGTSEDMEADVPVNHSRSSDAPHMA
ncbi:hypothetical protein R1sor_009343 [Riccia sorocarpa]|uniref:Uncharacterized protein n=1 Tax=Riccia sorocarpa TaxID=122646 RepID=A0ABD3HUT9_9MARC